MKFWIIAASIILATGGVVEARGYGGGARPQRLKAATVKNVPPMPSD